jgi:hypothetical protein
VRLDERHPADTGGPRSDRAAQPDWVYDFVAAPSDVPAGSSIGSGLSAPSTPLTTGQIQTGRQFGALVAKDLAADIQGMGLSAVKAGPGSSPQVGDGVIRGYLVSVQGGSALKRFAIGFGSGTSEMDTVVEGYLMTPARLAQTGVGDAQFRRKQNPRNCCAGAIAIATGNPVGLIVVGGMKIYGETSGKNTLEGEVQGDRRRNREAAQNQIPGPGLVS